MKTSFADLLRSFFFLLFTLGVALLPMYFLGKTLTKWVNLYDLSQNSRQIQAEILSVESLTAYDNDGYVITYRFFIPGLTGGWYTVEQYTYYALAAGSLVPVTYLPESPTISQLGDATVDATLLIETLVIGFLGFMAAIPVGAALLKIGRGIILLFRASPLAQHSLQS